MKLAIVTSADKNFIPGVKALHKSLVKNANISFDFILIAHGKEENFDDLDVIKVFNPELVGAPTSSKWPESIPAMYSRVLIPRLFPEYDRVLWLDSDIIVLKSLGKLVTIDMEGFPVAATSPGATFQREELRYLPFQLEKPELFENINLVKSIQAGMILFDINEWNSRGLDRIIDSLLTSNIKFKFVVQGLLSMALMGQFKEVPYNWNCPVSWVGRYDLKTVHVLHYVGGKGRNPWQTNMKLGELWKLYYDNC